MNDTPATTTHWDVFCSVIDNFGDIGVSWRLARALVREHGLKIRLWVDDPVSFAMLEPRFVPREAWQTLEGVDILHWTPAAQAFGAPGAAIIEAFGCRLGDAFEARMAERRPAPAWINLEYLSAEEWVGGCHRMASPHPRLPLTRHFFYPGFTSDTGGLLREAGLREMRERFQGSSAALAEFWHAHAGIAPSPDALRVSLFAYENGALPGLLDAWVAGERSVFCAVPVGRPLAGVARWAQREELEPGSVIARGNLTLVVLPFLQHMDYDRLLWACDLNFVRGEDSFVRAQWAARPLVWHIYPQRECAHLEKLEAFRTRYAARLPAPEAAALKAFWLAWNDEPQHIASAWAAFSDALPGLATHARAWDEELAAQPDLATQLVGFCKALIE